MKKILELTLEELDFLIDIVKTEDGEVFIDPFQAKQNEEMLKKLLILRGRQNEA